MSYLQLKGLDFSKANLQLRKEVQSKLFSSSKQLRTNRVQDKENQCSNSQFNPPQALKAIQVLSKLLRNRMMQALSVMKCSDVGDRVFDEVDSVGCSEQFEHLEHFNNQLNQIESMIRQSQVDGYKISFANIPINEVNLKKRSKTNFTITNSLNLSTIKDSYIKDSCIKDSYIKLQYTSQNFQQLFIVIQNIRKRKEYMTIQQLRVHVLQHNLQTITERLRVVKVDTLRKVVISKIKNNNIVTKVCLQYWRQQAFNLKSFHYHVANLEAIFRKHNKQHFKTLKYNGAKQQSIKIINKLCNKQYHWNALLQYNNKLQISNIIMRLYKNSLKSSFKNIQTVSRISNTQKMDVFDQIIQSRKVVALRIMRLHGLRSRRKLKSIGIGSECLETALNAIQYRYVFKQMQSKQLRKKYIIQTKYLIMVIQQLRMRTLRHSYFKLAQGQL